MLNGVPRLKQPLGLPKIEPRPPCPPKAYQKLYRYLDAQLPIGTRRSGRSATVAQKHDEQASRVSAGKSSVSNVPQRFLSSRPKPTSNASDQREPPSWVMPVIRRLCQQMYARAATVHVFAGVSSVWLSVQRSHDKVEPNLAALIIVLYILVTTRLTGEKLVSDVYFEQKESALEIIGHALQERKVQSGCNDTDIDVCMRQVKEYQWTEMDWFNNVEIGSGVNPDTQGPAEETDDIQQTESEDEAIPTGGTKAFELDSVNEGYLQPGLGTMMDAKVDFLSDARRRSFERWKLGILRRIDDVNA